MTILMLQVVLIRIFSVTMGYHFAFMSISLALFGAAVGGVVSYLLPKVFSLQPGRSERQAATAAVLFGLAVVVAVAIHLAAPPGMAGEPAASGGLVGLFVILATPFFFAGLAMALLLSTYPAHTSRIYFADLLGAGTGCLLAILALNVWGGPGAILAIAALAMAAGLLLGCAGGWSRWARLASGSMTVLLLAALLVNANLGWLTIRYARGQAEQGIVFEGWNSFSRITVAGSGEPRADRPASWALSPTFQGHDPGSRLLRIDGDAGTAMVRFAGDLEPLSFLQYDLSALAYRLQSPDAGRVLIIGPGGGRDILAARLFGRPEIVGVEINPLIVETVNDRFGAYSGRPYSLPGVHHVVADARSFLAHAGTSDRYALIQATLIDTWASAASGAYALSENFLYTREAFGDYYRHLSDDGMLTMSRWYLPDQPAEALRLLALARTAWADMGVAAPEQHIVMVSTREPMPGWNWKLATLIVKRSPFSADEIERLRQETDSLGFTLLYAPGLPAATSDIAAVMHSQERTYQDFVANYVLNIHPPTDDSPFFFSLLLPRDFWSSDTVLAGYSVPPHALMARVFVKLLHVVTALCLLVVVGPLVVSRLRRRRSGPALRASSVLFLAYAACLGIGFMLLETVLMQRFILFLGHPVYALAVILFTLLVFGGVGSWLTSLVPAGRLGRAQLGAVSAVILATVGQALAVPALLHALLGIPEWGRVVATVILLAPLGIVLGMPFPLGVRLADERQDRLLIPWAWAINGASSVLASVGSVILALAGGFTWVILLAAVMYALALLLAAWPILRPGILHRSANPAVPA